MALTLGHASYLCVDENTTFKVEYRLDGANQPVFANVRRAARRSSTKSNHLLGASVVVSF
jgi:hypothetical protein